MPRDIRSLTEAEHTQHVGSVDEGADDLSVSVEECLKIAPLDRAEVVAGHQGLTRRINWVHVVDHRDMEDSLASNELLLTSGIALSQDRSLQSEIFEIMDRKKSAGLVVAIGEYMPDIPTEMQALADKYEIPVLTVPWEVNFGDITRILLTQFVASHYKVMELSQSLSEELLDIVLKKGDLTAVCERIERVLGWPAFIFDESLRQVASGNADQSELALRTSQLRRGLATLAFDRSSKVTAHVITTDGVEKFVAAPISVSGRRRGYIALLPPQNSVKSTARLGEIAAQITALVIAHEDEILRVAKHADGRLLGILDGTIPARSGSLAEVGLRGNEPVVVIVVDFDQEAASAAMPVMQSFLRGRSSGVALTVRGSSVVGLLQRLKDRAPEWTHKLEQVLRQQGYPCQIGLSGSSELGEIAARHDDVRELLRLRHFLQPSDMVINAEHSVTILRTLRTLVSSGEVEQLCPAIIRIRERDRSLHGSLIEALSCLLEVDGNISLAARQLGIHRHTMLYRLNRISEILGTELNASMRFELRLQLLAWSFAGGADRAEKVSARPQVR